MLTRYRKEQIEAVSSRCRTVTTGVACFVLGILGSWINDKWQETAFGAVYPDWDYEPTPIPLVFRALMVGGFSLSMIGIVLLIYRFMDSVHSRVRNR